MLFFIKVDYKPPTVLKVLINNFGKEIIQKCSSRDATHGQAIKLKGTPAIPYEVGSKNLPFKVMF
jgi:hypothetical protein